MKVYITEVIARKLKETHRVSEQEVMQCFHHREGKFAYDTRERHQTNPPTVWFIAPTDVGRRLKVVFVMFPDQEYVLKSAFDADSESEDLYQIYKQRG